MPEPSPLRQARDAQGKLLKDVAEEADCAISLVSMVERGAPASREKRDAIARAVGASYGTFWQDGS